MDEQIRRCFDVMAKDGDIYRRNNWEYHDRIRRFYQQIIPRGSRVLEIGCARGDLIASVEPSYGLGIDISGNMVEEAKRKYPDLDFRQGEIEALPPRTDFDYIILSNLVDYIEDLYLFFYRLKDWTNDNTKIVITNFNPLWAPVVRMQAKLWLRVPEAQRNFVTLLDICNILDVLGYDVSESGYRLISPLYIPLVSFFLNKLVPRLYAINNLSSTQYVVCRRKQAASKRDALSCTVVVPCHNEEGNVEECVKRIPTVGRATEIIIVDDGSTDKTYDIAQRLSREDPRVRMIRFDKNRGKANAVKAGFDNATGDVLVILDADMAVMPEEIPKFFNTIADGRAEFVNGTRMVYPIEKEAMKFANYIGNKIFGIVLSVIVGQRNTDTLCGTKGLLKRHWQHIDMKGHGWGDFDLLYGAARLKLKMVEMPVRYKKRMSGRSKMKALRHGLGMLKICSDMFWALE